jgi:hypothetical protein
MEGCPKHGEEEGKRKDGVTNAFCVEAGKKLLHFLSQASVLSHGCPDLFLFTCAQVSKRSSIDSKSL